MDKFTLGHGVFLSQSYVKCKFIKKGQGKFRRKFPGVQVPHRNTIQNHINRVRNGMLIDWKPKHQHWVLTKEKLDNIRVHLEYLPL
jgi:hypothetical protein